MGLVEVDSKGRVEVVEAVGSGGWGRAAERWMNGVGQQVEREYKGAGEKVTSAEPGRGKVARQGEGACLNGSWERGRERKGRAGKGAP